ALLERAALRIWALAARIVRGEGLDPRSDLGSVDAPGPAALLETLACELEGRVCRCQAIERIGHHPQLADLLLGEGKPAAKFRRQSGFEAGVDGHVQQRTRGRRLQALLAEAVGGAAREQHGPVEVGAPDV